MRVYLFSLLLLLSAAQGHAEIQRIIVHWQGPACTPSCVALLTQKLQGISGVASVTVTPAAQTAELSWNSLYPFNYLRLKWAVKSVHPGVVDIRVVVRGVIQFQNNQFWIVSIGDNTMFTLIGPPIVPPGAQSQYYSPYYSQPSNPLSVPMQQALLSGMQQQRVALVQGLLYSPEGGSGNLLIVENVQFVQP